MDNLSSFLPDFAMVLCVAAVTTILFHKLKQPPVLGYLLAGLILGPHVPSHLFAHEATVKTLAQLGVILVMFSIGLKFSIRRLMLVLPTAGVTCVIEMSVMIWLGYTAAQLMGWSPLESIFTGAIVAISSTMIASKALLENQTDEKLNRMVFSVLVVQDLAAVLLLAILTPICEGTKLTLMELAITSGSLFGFLIILFGVGYLIIPFLLRQVIRFQNKETLLVTSVGLCFAMALLAQKGGYSVALGAFLAGMLVAESGVSTEVAELTNPLRDIFAAVFFVAMGMLVNPATLIVHWRAILVLAFVILIGQTLSVAFGAFLSGRPLNSAIQAGMSLAQIGEFSYIIAQTGVTNGNVSPYVYDVTVALSVVSAFTTPWFIRFSGPVSHFVDTHLPKPLQTFTTLYASWLEDLRQGSGEQSLTKRARKIIGILIIDTFFLILIVITLAASIKKWIPHLQHFFYFTAMDWRVLLVALGIILALPFLFSILKCAKLLGGLIASSAIPLVSANRLDLGQAPRKVLTLTLQIGILFAVGFPLLALTQPFLPFGYSPALFAVILAILGSIFWKNAVNLQEHVQAGAQMVTQALSNHSSQSTQIMEQISQMVPGIGGPQSLLMRPENGAVGKSLSALNLRSKVGTSVIAIMRNQERLLMPSGNEVLQAGDTLILVGSHQAIRQAIEILEKGPSA